MEKAFMFGLAVGMLAGALIVANSQKVRGLVKKGQQQVEKQMQDLTEKTEKGAKNQQKKSAAAN